MSETQRDIWEVANQLGGYVDPSTDERLARFLIREANEAEKLAQQIISLQAELAKARNAALEDAAKVIEDHIVQDTSAGKVLKPRQDGNRDGLSYAAAIRALREEE